MILKKHIFLSCSEVRDAEASGDRDSEQRSSQQAGVHAKAVWDGETSGAVVFLKTPSQIKLISFSLWGIDLLRDGLN